MLEAVVVIARGEVHGRQHDADTIEYKQTGPFAHLFGQVLEVDPCGEFCKQAGDFDARCVLHFVFPHLSAGLGQRFAFPYRCLVKGGEIPFPEQGTVFLCQTTESNRQRLRVPGLFLVRVAEIEKEMFGERPPDELEGYGQPVV